MLIRELGLEQEKDTAIALSWLVFMRFIAPNCEKQGVETFKRFIQNKEYIATLKIFGAFTKDEMVGIIGIKDHKEINLFFVKDDYQRQGIGRQLLRYVLKNELKIPIEIKVPPCGLIACKCLGFKLIVPFKVKEGIKFATMCYKGE